MKSLWIMVALCFSMLACTPDTGAGPMEENGSSTSTESFGRLGEIVDKQLEAFNNHDLEAFLEFFHPDIEAYDFSGELELRGMESLRETFKETFSFQPNEVVDERIISGNYVIDKIAFTYVFEGETMTEGGVVIYTIEDELIRKLTFLR